MFSFYQYHNMYISPKYDRLWWIHHKTIWYSLALIRRLYLLTGLGLKYFVCILFVISLTWFAVDMNEPLYSICQNNFDLECVCLQEMSADWWSDNNGKRCDYLPCLHCLHPSCHDCWCGCHHFLFQDDQKTTITTVKLTVEYSDLSIKLSISKHKVTNNWFH